MKGRCRFCKCEGDCRLQDGDECMWRTKEQNVCTRSECLMAFQAERDAEEKRYNAMRRQAAIALKSKSQKRKGRRPAFARAKVLSSGGAA